MPPTVSQSIAILSTQLESPRLVKDLEDCRKTCLNVSITGSAGLAVGILTLMLYTISLHIAATAGASRHLGVVIFAILHAMPAVGIFAVISVELAFAVKSPIAAISIIIFCFLPTMVTIFHYTQMTISGDLPSAPSAERSDHTESPV
ncbi:hypothetical protein K503DRAFT_779435 [Rhizopogon vinicolor AM-OR11-026]|uniref:Uncharacterized protein n=1 Tax=Rhizopogon vinicolor AM-OR11-026 TaxID=1314800 RepID=A0A1B7NED1_9AGAM|nr:hypothetical protein K503DRAFT_779435 [Rhizopogon vinicolor AM-OR11-026]